MATKQRRKRIAYTGKTFVEEQPKEVPEVVIVPDTITSQEDATLLVQKSYKQSLELDYVVLENGNVFLGQNNRSVALKYAKRFDLKYFDVKI